MGRWSKERKAQEASKQASAAARILGQRAQEVRAEKAQEQEQPFSEQPEGVERSGDDEERQAPPPRNEPRRLAMEEIEARHERTSKNPYEDSTVEDVAPKQDAAPDVAPEQQTPPLTPPETPVVAETPQPEIKTIRVKVDGEEFDVPEGEVQEAGGVTAYQKDRAAENRLKKANESLAETRRLQATIAEMVAKQSQPAPLEVKTVPQLLQENIDTIRWGTPEESAAAFQKVIEAANPRIDTNQITEYAVAKMQQQNGLENFKKEFSDVVGNPLVMKLAVTLEQERLIEIKNRGQRVDDWTQFYRAIGNESRSVMGRPSQPSQAGTTDSTSQPGDKEARKASIVNLPTAAARAALPEAQKPETRADILNDLRKSRGIPTG